MLCDEKRSFEALDVDAGVFGFEGSVEKALGLGFELLGELFGLEEVLFLVDEVVGVEFVVDGAVGVERGFGFG